VNHKAKRSDAGIYKVVLKNSEGSASIAFKVNVLDSPSMPTGPLEVLNLDAESCTLSWKPPVDNGGNEISNYVVEKKEAGSNKLVDAFMTYLSNLIFNNFISIYNLSYL
jgi:titin